MHPVDSGYHQLLQTVANMQALDSLEIVETTRKSMSLVIK